MVSYAFVFFYAFRPDTQNVTNTEEMIVHGHDYLKYNDAGSDNSVFKTVARLSRELQELKHEITTTNGRLLTLNAVKEKPDLFQFYTNLPNYDVFDALCDYLSTRYNCEGSSLRRWKGSKEIGKRSAEGRGLMQQTSGNRKLTFREEFFLVLVKLKTGRLNRDLAFSFGISSGLVSELFTSWLFFLETELKLLFEVSDSDSSPTQDGVPQCFKSVPDLRAVIDCTELMLQEASNLHERKCTFSNYKHHDTVKFMVSMSPNLYVNYVSKAWGGRASDKHITTHSFEFLDGLAPGSQVMADRGFTVSDELMSMGIKLILPVVQGTWQITDDCC
jgi:hypothetical protein